MTKKPINFWDDYLNTRLSWAESTGARAQKKKTPNRVTTDGRKLPRNIYKLGDKEKYKALVERVMGMKKVLHYVGIYDTVEEAIEAQLIWIKLNERRRSRIDL